MSHPCNGCGCRTVASGRRCRTCQSKTFHAGKRVAKEGLIVDLAGGAWWIWDSKGEVLVMAENSKANALLSLACGGNVEE